MEYNTTRDALTIREYGRHIQKMADLLLAMEDREQRTRGAYGLVELMGFLNPHVKSMDDYKHKLWDHLHIITNFNLDVDAPYPKPTREKVEEKPAPMPYPGREPKYNHLGKNIESVIEKALNEGDAEKQQALANTIAYYMKLTYSNWHKELVHDDNIQTELNAITNGELEFNNKPFVKHRNDAPREEFVSNIGKSRKNYGQRQNRQQQNRNRKFKKKY